MRHLAFAAITIFLTGGTASACIQFGYDIQGYMDYLICLHDEQVDVIGELGADLERLEDDLEELDDDTGDHAVILWNRDVEQIQMLKEQAQTIRDLEAAIGVLENRVLVLEQRL